MSRLEDIGVHVQPVGAGAQEWGNALPILHEIRHGLGRLAETGEPTLIDLRAVPFGPGDEERLLSLLGRGEVEATLEALGTTRIWESAVPAVWLIDHYNGEGERIALHIHIDRIPDILCTQTQDIAEAAGLLDARLRAADEPGGD
jgi:hydrogenase-1 operon protein HyaF